MMNDESGILSQEIRPAVLLKAFCRTRLRVITIATMTLVMIAGCQQTTPIRVQKMTGNAPALPTDRTPTADEAVGSDACSNRLHDISGAILGYYLANRQLPDLLEEVKPFADAGTDLKFTCPDSNQPYQYSRQGLMANGTDKRLFVWDRLPTRGFRWGIVMVLPAPGQPIQADVVGMSEKEFSAFVPPIQ